MNFLYCIYKSIVLYCIVLYCIILYCIYISMIVHFVYIYFQYCVLYICIVQFLRSSNMIGLLGMLQVFFSRYDKTVDFPLSTF